jgi:hypothetical protein
MTPSHGLETGEDLLFLQCEVFQTPLEAHEKGILIGIDVLLEVDDVSAMGEDESRDIMDQTGAVRAVNEKRGGVRHGIEVTWSMGEDESRDKGEGIPHETNSGLVKRGLSGNCCEDGSSI